MSVIRRLWRWATHGPEPLGHIDPWDAVIADRHAATTAQMLLGDCQVVSRVDLVVEAREARVADRRAKDAIQRQAVRVLWQRRSV